MKYRYRCLVFDLDDTLLDTHSQLVPQAARESCQAMISAGLNSTLETALAERANFIAHEPRGNVYAHLVRAFAVRDDSRPEDVVAAGYNAFHHRDVKENIQMFAGSREMLARLKEAYVLFLVTAGNVNTQRRKVEILEIEILFRAIHYIDPTRGQSKIDAFRAIERSEGGAPESYLSIGNRVDSDIAFAKVLGWDTCWVRAGEYAHMLPNSRNETPDYEILRIEQLEAILAAP